MKKRIYKQITKRQAGVFFRAWKEGKAQMTEEQVRELYALVDYDGYDDNGSWGRMNDRLLVALDAFFEGNVDGMNEQLKRAFA